VVPPEQPELGQQATGLLRGEGPALGLVQDLFGIGAPSRRGHLAHWIAVDGPFVHGELQDPQHQRPALHEGGVAGAAGELCLPAADVGRADVLDRLVVEPGPHIEPQAALGDGEGGGTAVWIGGPDLPPLFGPPAEGKLAALEPLPGTAGDPQPLLGDQVARLLLAADGLGALGAIVQEPPHLWKCAASLDGRIAAADGSSKWITSAEARADGHRLRAECGAVMVGSGTQQADDPQLAVRDAEVTRQPLRIVVDSNARTPASARVLDDAAPTLITVAEDADASHLDGRADVVRLPRVDAGLDLELLLKALSERGVRAILLEGGPTLAGSFLAAGLIDRVVAYIAPVLIAAVASRRWPGLAP
jgi:diaminohydroxyphosphoribosylaminopyrimidine deaminase / 5-amino-6-(5-phosphoribosylamino)uracil reductase